mgnify:CR=1 FL=1
MSSSLLRPLLLLWPLIALVALTAGCEAEHGSTGRGFGNTVAETRAVSASPSPLAGSGQLVLVVAKNWNADQAWLRRFERTAGGKWRPQGDAVRVTLGRNGLAWGRGVHGAALGPGPVKVEGDGRSPAGVFTFATAFAYQPEELWKPVHMPMHRVTARTVCVETIDSKSYNRIVEEGDQTPQDWVQTDKMLRPDGLYRYGLLVNNNAPDTEPGAGSCIFFHIWRRPGAPTAGCTAMNTAAIQVILAWLDSTRQPVLVQLPEAELARLAPQWGAPELAVAPPADDQ